MLEANDLTFAHPGQAGRYHFSLLAEAGEVTAVSGASGAGKSTLFDLLAGFLSPSAGTLRLDGESLLGLPPERRPVSLLLQSDNLFDHLSARDNVVLGLDRRTPRSEARRRADVALAEVGLAGMGGQRAGTLSGGQKQRVALARTLLRDRAVLLLDEPFSALDDDTRRSARELVGALTRRQGWHTLLVSHHEEDVVALASRRYRLDDGRLLEVPVPARVSSPRP